MKYTTYRLGGNFAKESKAQQERSPGFRVTGEISQDLDLFRMPVDLQLIPPEKPKISASK